MGKIQFIVLLSMTIMLSSCKKNVNRVVTSDIDNFWNAYDKIITTKDTLLQYKYLDSLYLKKGTPGLYGMIESKRYENKDFMDMIHKFPKFLQSIRSNTLQSKQLADELENGVDKFKAIYPELSSSKIYFTVGAMRSGGTTLDSLVLIGSELAMVDKNADISEFKGSQKKWIEKYIATNPLKNIVLLNVHEYVHTQQTRIPTGLLYQCLYEGVAEFVSVKAMNTSSSSPAIAYGKSNAQVKEIFEKEMFYDWTYQWLWSDYSPRNLGVRDLGYYIGYAIAEQHYNNSPDKKIAIKELIELDYDNLAMVDDFIDNTGYFSKTIDQLRAEDKNNRPSVLKVQEFDNNSQNVNPNINTISINFSKPLNGLNTGLDFGELGREGFPEVTKPPYWSEANRSWTIPVKLEPNKEYEILISNNFRTQDQVALQPYLIKFKTGK